MPPSRKGGDDPTSFLGQLTGTVIGNARRNVDTDYLGRIVGRTHPLSATIELPYSPATATGKRTRESCIKAGYEEKR